MAIEVHKNVSLKPFNTFGLEVFAAYFTTVKCIDDCIEILSDYQSLLSKGLLILGGGSNVLLSKDFEGLVVKNEIKGIQIEKENDQFVWVKAGGGEVWHDLVVYTVDKGWGGLENLSLIPGTVGAAPMQNIGAYGTEIKDCFEYLEALNLATRQIERFDAERCDFGYRESFFKHDGKGKYLISNVCFKLNKQAQVNTSYGVINDVLHQNGVVNPSIKDVSNAVIEIRRSKLPDPKEIGNSGSFFKNPTITREQAEKVKASFPEIPSYAVEGSTDVKFPAGWLIEQAGWKGFRAGDAGVHAKQALVLVNYGMASGTEIIDLSEEIKKSVKAKFGIQLETEVNIL